MDKDYLIEKWLKDELTEAEKINFDALEDATFNNSIIQDAQFFKASNFSEPSNFYDLEKRLLDREPQRSFPFFKNALRFASVIVIGFGIYFLFFNTPLVSVQTLASEKKELLLPDNSKVILNALSEINFHEKNWNDHREVQLNGEAFFDVEKGQKFDVITQQGTITVLGTKFKVKERDHYFEVVCYEGIVSVTTNKITRKLNAGDSYAMVDKILMEGNTMQSQPSWLDNRSSFKSVPFNEVLFELERQYNIRIEYQGLQNKRLFTGAFVHTNLENALNSITKPLALKYQITSSKKVIITDE